LERPAVSKLFAGIRIFWEEKMSKIMKSLVAGTALTAASATMALAEGVELRYSTPHHYFAHFGR